MYFLNWFTGTVIREEVGLSLDKAGKEVLGSASKVVLTKDTTTIVGDGSTQEAVNKRVAQIKNLIEVFLSSSIHHNVSTCKRGMGFTESKTNDTLLNGRNILYYFKSLI